MAIRVSGGNSTHPVSHMIDVGVLDFTLRAIRCFSQRGISTSPIEYSPACHSTCAFLRVSQFPRQPGFPRPRALKSWGGWGCPTAGARELSLSSCQADQLRLLVSNDQQISTLMHYFEKQIRTESTGLLIARFRRADSVRRLFLLAHFTETHFTTPELCHRTSS